MALCALQLEDECHGSDSIPNMSYLTVSIAFLLMIPNIPGNLLEILAVALDPYKKLRTPFNFMMTNLAVADLVVGVVTEPMSIYIHWKEGMGEHVTLGELRVLFMSYFISCTASLLSLATLAVERYLAIRYPYIYKNQLTKRRVLRTAIGIWTISIALSCIYFKVGYVTYAFIFANTAIVITITIICFMYYLMYRALKMRARSDTPVAIVDNGTPESHDQSTVVENGNALAEYQNERDESTSPENKNTTVHQNAPSKSHLQNNSAENSVPESHSQNEHENTPSAPPESCLNTAEDLKIIPEQNTGEHENATPDNHQSRIYITLEQRLTKRFLVVLMALLLCYGPSTILIYAMAFCASCSCTTLHWLRDLQFLFVIANSSVNFFAYALRSSRFRKAFAKILRIKTRERSLATVGRMADSSTDIMNV